MKLYKYMTIGIDARTIVGQRVGKGQYTYNLVKALAKIDAQNQYLLYCSKALPEDLKLSENFKQRIIKRSSLFWHLAALAQLKKDKVDVFLAPTSYIIPALGHRKSMVVVHDLFSFLGLASHQKKATIIERLTAQRAFACTRKIIAISQNTKKDIVRLFRVDPKRVSVIYLGVDKQFIAIQNKSKIDRVLKQYKLPDKFFLFVSTLEPRKNVVRLIKAYYKLTKLLSYQVAKLPCLVLVGQKGWNYQEIFNTVEKLNLKDKIIFADYIKNKDLPYLYNAALAFILPSLYEGFGLPVLEAMACGCPVITSNISSLPEVGGEAVLYIDPYKVDEIAKAMEKILSDKDLRDNLREKGLAQARKFSWERTARETLDVLESIKNSKRVEALASQKESKGSVPKS